MRATPGSLVPPSAASPLYFLHIPKTAGTSIIDVLDQRYAPEAICPAQLIDPLLACPAEILRRAHLFRGHLGAGLDQVAGRPLVTFTMLRDPVARTCSHFRHVRREPGHPLHQHVNAPGFDLLAFAQDPATQPLVRNYQARHLTRSIAHAPDRVAPFGLHPLARQMAFDLAPMPLDDGALLRAGLAALEEIDVVGTVEEGAGAALSRLAAAMGWREPVPAGRLRVAPPDGTRVDPEAEAAIRRLTQVDGALHAAASAHAPRLPPHRSWWWQPERRAGAGSGWDDLRWSDAIGWHRWALGPETVAVLDGPDNAGDGDRRTVRVDIGAARSAEALARVRLDADGADVPYARTDLPSGGQRLTAHLPASAHAPRTVRLRASRTTPPAGLGLAVSAIAVTPGTGPA